MKIIYVFCCFHTFVCLGRSKEKWTCSFNAAYDAFSRRNFRVSLLSHSNLKYNSIRFLPSGWENKNNISKTSGH